MSTGERAATSDSSAPVSGTNSPDPSYSMEETHTVLKFLLWCFLFVLCWPLALIALILYPFVWLLLLPFRLIGITVGAVFELLWAMLTLPARVLRKLA